MSILTKKRKAFVRRIGRSLQEVRLMEQGKGEERSIEELLNSLPDGSKNLFVRLPRYHNRSLLNRNRSFF